ncbi:MAG: paraquat-inducible protein A [Gammaproteobacteria bacterium]|jgi:paraquat-inducible protein A
MSLDHSLSRSGLTACHECDLLHHLAPLEPGARAFCSRCGALLYREAPGGLVRPLALALAALGLFIITNVFPFVALNIEGRVERNLVVSGIRSLWSFGMPELAVLVALTSVVFPALIIIGLLWLTLSLRSGIHPPGATLIVRIIKAIGPWTLLSVFMLGTLIAFVKLQDIATVIPGVSMFAFGALIVTMTAAANSFDISLIWPRVGPRGTDAVVNGDIAHLHGLQACHTCALLVASPPPAHPLPGTHDRFHCPRCAAPLHGARKHDSISRTWALIFAAVVLIIPANVYPVMTVIQFGRGEPNTIVSGVLHLIDEGMWGLALIVFVASVVVPVLKLLLLSYLLISVQSRSAWRPRDRTRLYRITEIVGAWSMVDIFLVGILTALVNLQALASITPNIGASFFGAVVVITMFAAHSFDPRLIWDHGVQKR